MKIKLNLIKPTFYHSIILAVFISSAACLEVDNIYSSLGLNTNWSSGYATLYLKRMVEVDGFLYVANSKLHIIEKIDIATGTKTVWAGSSGTTGYADGAVASALFNYPNGIAYKGGTNPKLYVTDQSCVLREIDMNTQVTTTVVGVQNSCGNVDGTGTVARIQTNNSNSDLAISGNTLYVSQGLSIRAVDLTNYAVTSPIGAASTAGFVNDTGTAARFKSITALTAIGNNLYVADTGNYTIRKVDLTTLAVTSFVGTGTSGFLDATGLSAKITMITAMTNDGDSYIYASDFGNNAIRSINITNTTVATVVGDPSVDEDISGTLSTTKLAEPLGVLFSKYGLFFCNSSNIRRIH